MTIKKILIVSLIFFAFMKLVERVNSEVEKEYFEEHYTYHYNDIHEKKYADSEDNNFLEDIVDWFEQTWSELWPEEEKELYIER
ncbi:MAG: hypothetical protein H7A33_02650 [Deltaproteobacteria bacterium]|nr:hypothetical protein [Deltaproteobacteria bacterium]